MIPRILLVEAERDLIERVSRLLAAESFDVELAGDGDSGFIKAATTAFDLIILDTALSGKTGFAVCDELRRKGIDTSILMLAAKARAEECVRALRLGADDCVARSCDSNELMARVEALLRRVPRRKRAPVTLVRFGDVEVDFGLWEAKKAGQRINMAMRELRLLQYLVDHRDRVVSRKEILKHVWEYDSAVSSRTIDVHIGWLRQKLEDNPQEPKYIRTIRSRGYRFDSDQTHLLASTTARRQG